MIQFSFKAFFLKKNGLNVLKILHSIIPLSKSYLRPGKKKSNQSTKLFSHLLNSSQHSDLKAVNCHCQNCFHSKSIISRLNLENTHFWWCFLLHFRFDRLHSAMELKGMENWIIYCCQVFWAAVEPSGTVIVKFNLIFHTIELQSHFDWLLKGKFALTEAIQLHV